MDDLISRQAALDALGEAPEVWTDSPEEFAALSQWEMDVTAIGAVPTADRPSGEWLARDCVFGVVYCSECGYELRQNDTNYCPNCGCRMKGADDG